MILLGILKIRESRNIQFAMDTLPLSTVLPRVQPFSFCQNSFLLLQLRRLISHAPSYPFSSSTTFGIFAFFAQRLSRKL